MSASTKEASLSPRSAVRTESLVLDVRVARAISAVSRWLRGPSQLSASGMVYKLQGWRANRESIRAVSRGLRGGGVRSGLAAAVAHLSPPIRPTPIGPENGWYRAHIPTPQHFDPLLPCSASHSSASTARTVENVSPIYNVRAPMDSRRLTAAVGSPHSQVCSNIGPRPSLQGSAPKGRKLGAQLGPKLQRG